MEVERKYRAELHPATNAWMSGDRFGDLIKKTPRGNYLIKLDKSGRTILFGPENVSTIFPADTWR